MAKLAQVENPFTLRNHTHIKKEGKGKNGALQTMAFMAAENLGDAGGNEEGNGSPLRPRSPSDPSANRFFRVLY